MSEYPPSLEWVYQPNDGFFRSRAIYGLQGKLIIDKRCQPIYSEGRELFLIENFIIFYRNQESEWTVQIVYNSILMRSR